MSPEELQRRRLLLARANGVRDPEHAAIEARDRLRYAQEAAERAAFAQASARAREPARLTNEFDPGAPRRQWEREAQRGGSVAPTSTPPLTQGGPPAEQQKGDNGEPRIRRVRRFRVRGWKPRKRKAELSDSVLKFVNERGWTPERSRALATRTKKNDAVIAHPRAAQAALLQLPSWSRAAVLRCMRGQGWTFADECGRRQLATWLTLEDFSRPRAYARPRRFGMNVGGAVRFRGTAKYGLAVVGWTQSALAIALSGAATTDGGADPIDVKTVQRHIDLAVAYGGVQKVVRNPDAEPEHRGLPTDSNPRGWPINEYWIPAENFAKPGFAGRWFDADGRPIALDESLAIELQPRMKRARRLRELRERPPPIAS